MSVRGEVRMAEIKAEQERERTQGYYRNAHWTVKALLIAFLTAMGAFAGLLVALVVDATMKS